MKDSSNTILKQSVLQIEKKSKQLYELKLDKENREQKDKRDNKCAPSNKEKLADLKEKVSYF